MKKKKLLPILFMTLAIVLTGGCEGNQPSVSPSDNTVSSGTTTTDDPAVTQGTDPQNNEQQPSVLMVGHQYDDGFISPIGSGKSSFDEDVLTTLGYSVVRSMKGLLSAIRPGARIVLAPAKYELSEYLQTLWDESADTKAAGIGILKLNAYTEIRMNNGSPELVITNTDDLTICGGSAYFNETQITTDSGDVAVLRFEGCDGLHLANLSIGHSGRRSGNILELSACKNSGLYNLDLGGGGLCGLTLSRGCTDLSLYDCMIRECTNGAFSYIEGKGMLRLTNCSLLDSSGISYSATTESQIYMDGCILGNNETASLAFRDDITMIDCTLGQIPDYPEYEGYTETFDPLSCDMDAFTETDAADCITSQESWTGYSFYDPAKDETCYLPYFDEEYNALIEISASFSENGEATDSRITINGVSFNAGWNIADGQAVIHCDLANVSEADLATADITGSDIPAEFYLDTGSGHYWMKLILDGREYLLY